MNWQALDLSLRLGAVTVLCLVPVAVAGGRLMAHARFRGKPLVEALIALPLVLPPTVLGFVLLVAFGLGSPLGRAFEALFGQRLVFSFEGLVLASIVANLPFALQPAQRAFEAIPPNLREAAACCGLSTAATLVRIELPLAWPGIVSGLVLTFAHTLGEFGIVLMVGGSIPGETRTVAIAIYDAVQAFDNAGAAAMSAVLLAVSLVAMGLVFLLSGRVGRVGR